MFQNIIGAKIQQHFYINSVCLFFWHGIILPGAMFIVPAKGILLHILAIVICRFLFFQWKERKGSH